MLLNDYWKAYRKCLLILLTNKKYIGTVTLAAVSAYFFFLTHVSIGVDDLASERYLSGEMLAQGRYTGQLINFLLPFEATDAVYNYVGISLYCFAAVLMAALLYKHSHKPCDSVFPYACFTCSFIVYPLVIEIFPYHGMPFAIGGNTILVVLSLIVVFSRIKGWFFIATIALAFASSWHEGEIPVYLCMAVAVLIVEQLSRCRKTQALSRKALAKQMLAILLPLAIGVSVEYASNKLVFALAAIDSSQISENSEIMYFNNPLLELLKKAYLDFKIDYLFKVGDYIPIALLTGCMVATLAFMLVLSIKYRRKGFCPLFMALLFACLSLSVVEGQLAPYRACQSYTFFVAFIIYLFAITVYARATLRAAFGTIMTILIAQQIIFLNQSFELDYLRSENEKSLVQSIGYDLATNYDVKPVVFTGEYYLGDYFDERLRVSSDNWWIRLLDSVHGISFSGHDGERWIYRNQTFCHSVISWGIEAFDEPNTELYRLFSYCGYDLVQGSELQYQLAKSNDIDDGRTVSIMDCGSFIRVHFGSADIVSD